MKRQEKSSIFLLKKKLQLAVEANQRWFDLMEKRKELEYNMDHLKSKIDELTLCIHEKKTVPDVLSKQLDENTYLLSEFKQKKRKLDATLDQLEESSEEKIEQLKHELIKTILDVHPEEKATYDQLQHTIKINEAFHQELDGVLDSCKPIVALLRMTIREQRERRGLGILKYLFGRSPHYILSQQLQAGELLTNTALSQLEQARKTTHGGPIIRELYEEATSILGDFRILCHKRWGLQKVDKVFSEIIEKLANCLDKLDVKRSGCIQERESLESRLRDWLNQRG